MKPKTRHIAEQLRESLHAPSEHVNVMAGSDSKGDVLTVFVTRDWKNRLQIPALFHGLRVKIAEQGELVF
ncbi:hypothetical protein [Lysobacter sp. 22409]|uniref:hypothetical protein n=1 Tax=Lysobacter sp. 22409 TaxID=3453917 RepID=UPI003F87DC09